MAAPVEEPVMFEVTNQPPPLDPYNLLSSDTALREAVSREGAAWALPQLGGLGASSSALRRRSRSALPRTKIRRGCALTTVSATASTRSIFTRPGTR